MDSAILFAIAIHCIANVPSVPTLQFQAKSLDLHYHLYLSKILRIYSTVRDDSRRRSDLSGAVAGVAAKYYLAELLRAKLAKVQDLCRLYCGKKDEQDPTNYGLCAGDERQRTRSSNRNSFFTIAGFNGHGDLLIAG